MLHFMKKISSTVSASLLALLLVFGLLPVGLAWGDEPSAPGASTAQSAEGADTTQTNSADADATGGAAGAHGASADGSTDGTNGADDAPAPDSASESLLVWAALDDDTVFSTLTQAEDAGVIVAPSNDFASYVADEIIVVYAEEEALVKEIAAVEEELANLSETDGVPTTEVLAADFEGQPLATVMLPEDVSVEDALLVAANSDSVVFAQPNFLYLPLAAPAPHIPNDPMTKSSSYNYQWAHDAVNDFQAWGFIDQKYSSSPRPVVSIGVLDTGMRLDHEDLVNATATGASGTLAWDAGRQQSLEVTANDPSITTDWYGDFNGHGTHVAGIAAAVADNNKGGAGSSYNSKVIPISLVDPDTGGLDTATIVVGINYLLGLPSSANVRVINMSLGGVEEDPFFHAAVIRANNAGILCVVAAGNINLSQGFTPGVTIYPASWPEVISVANLQQNSTRSSTSEYHATLDIAAPGTSLWSSYLSSSTSYVSMDGTSMASPLVAGIAALLFTYDPDITTAQAKQVLYDSARDRMSSDAADALGWDPYYGWGAIDAAGALAILDQVDGDYSKYTVTYHNNGADVATSTVPVDNAGYHPSAASVASPGYSPLGYYANSKVTVLAPTAAGGNLAKAHWTFQGWATTAGGPVVYTAGHEFAITANVNLYPVWLEDPTYTVTYHNTGADVATSTAPTDPASPYYAYETVAVLAPRAGNPAGNLAKANCAFLGWDTNSAAATVVYEPGATLAITANIDLYPVWKDSYDGAIITIASHKAPNQLLAIPGKAPTAGVQTVLGTKNNTAGQRFRLTLVDTNTYTITNISSGLVLDIYGGGIRDGAAVIQWTYKGSDNQLWHLLPNANGSVSIVSKADDSYCLDMTGGQTVNGTKIIIWKYTAGKINQQWDFTQITQTIPDGLYNIRTMGVGNRSLDVYGNSTKPGAEMLLWDFGGPAKVNQQFRVTYQPTTGFYAISCHSGLSVDVYGGSMTAGAQVIQWTFKTGNNLNQQWSIADNGLGNASYWIIGAQSGLALDVYGGNVANNGRIITWTYHGRANQQWSFTKLSA